MSPSGTEVALNFPEGAEAGMNPSGSGEVFVDCGCSQTGRCVGGDCGQNPAFLLRQKEKYEAAQKRKRAEDDAAKKALKLKQQQEGVKAAQMASQVMQEVLKQGVAKGGVRLQQGSIAWYGCPRCRWNRWGCATSADGLTIGCNPDRKRGIPYEPWKKVQLPDPPKAASSSQAPELQSQQVQPPDASTPASSSTDPPKPSEPGSSTDPPKDLADKDLKGGGTVHC